MSGGLRTEEGKEKGTRQRRRQEGGTKAGEAKGDQTRQRRGGRAENSRELGTGRHDSRVEENWLKVKPQVHTRRVPGMVG